MNLKTWKWKCWAQMTVMLLGSTLPAAAADNWFWKLGAGVYYSQEYVDYATSDLDAAMWDWLVVNYQSPEVFRNLGRYQKINPKQRYLIRICGPNDGGQYNDPHISQRPPQLRQAQFADHMFNPAFREKFEANLRAHLRMIRREAAPYWDNIFALTWLEEIPGDWADGREVCNGEKLPQLLEVYRPEIEAIRGKPLVWDRETWLWVGQQFAASLKRIHQIIKDETDGKMVIYWNHGGYGSLADLAKDVTGIPSADQTIYPYQFTDVVVPGLCDGFMVGGGAESYLRRRFLTHVEEHHWPYFNQLSYPAAMRLDSWEQTLQICKLNIPENLGYFLFAVGQYDASPWNAVPNQNPRNVSGVSSTVAQWRQVAVMENVGRPVVDAYFHLDVQLAYDLTKLQPGGYALITAVVTNVKDPDYYQAGGAVAQDVKVVLTKLQGLANDNEHSPPSVLTLGDLQPGEARKCEWWVKAKPDFQPQTARVSVVASSPNTQSGDADAQAQCTIPTVGTHMVKRSEDAWNYYAAGVPAEKPFVSLSTPSVSLRRPHLSNGEQSLCYNAVLRPGQRLELQPSGDARLFAHNVLPNCKALLADPTDPTACKAHRSGWGPAFTVNAAIEAGAQYRLTVPGKAEAGQGGYVQLDFLCSDGKIHSVTALDGAFKPEWSTPSAIIESPADAVLLKIVRLVRRNSPGKTSAIWFGQPSLEPVIPAEGLDVTDRLEGETIKLRRNDVNRLSYGDSGSLGGKTPIVRAVIEVRFAPDSDQTNTGSNQLMFQW